MIIAEFYRWLGIPHGKASVISCACIQKWIRCKTSSREAAIAPNARHFATHGYRLSRSLVGANFLEPLNLIAPHYGAQLANLFRNEGKATCFVAMQLRMLQKTETTNSHKEIMHMCVIWVTNPAYCQHDPCPLNRLWLNGDSQRNVHTTMGYSASVVVFSTVSTELKYRSQMEQVVQRLKVKVHMQTEQSRCVSIHVCVFGRKEAIQRKKRLSFAHAHGNALDTQFLTPRSRRIHTLHTHDEINSGVSPKKQYSSNHW